MVARTALRSFVFAVEFRTGRSGRIGAVLKRHEDHLIDRGARYGSFTSAIVEPECSPGDHRHPQRTTAAQLLRSPYLFAWFHAVGVPELTKGSRK